MLCAATYLLDNLDSWESFAGSESQPARLYPIPPPLQVCELLAMYPADLLGLCCIPPLIAALCRCRAMMSWNSRGPQMLLSCPD